MFAISMAVVVAAGFAAFAIARRLNGEASLLGGYLAGFAAGALIALLYLTRAGLPDETFRTATAVCLLELAALGPFLGVCAAKILAGMSVQWTAASKRAGARGTAVASGNMR